LENVIDMPMLWSNSVHPSSLLHLNFLISALLILQILNYFKYSDPDM